MPEQPTPGADTPYGPVPTQNAYDRAKSRLTSATSLEHQNPSEDMLRDVAEVNAWEWQLTQNMTPEDHAAEFDAMHNPPADDAAQQP